MLSVFSSSKRNRKKRASKGEVKLDKKHLRNAVRNPVLEGMHEAARSNKIYHSEAGHVSRVDVPDELVPWAVPFASYSPPHYTAQVVIQFDRTIREGGWADPPNFRSMEKEYLKRRSSCGDLSKLRFTHGPMKGFPRNPAGRTGMAGRGLLGKWGPNQAADNIITCRSPVSGKLYMVAIKREDTGQWAIPGGMVDDGEYVTKTLIREFREEAVGADGADMKQVTDEIFHKNKMHVVYRGYVDDPRNTDNAWMETTAVHCHCPPHLAERLRLTAGSDAVGAAWICVEDDADDPRYHNLYGGHKEIVRRAIELFREREKAGK